MSVLDFPRIHFRGRCLISPPTANNDDVMEAIDEAAVGLEPALVAEPAGDVKSWLIERRPSINALNHKQFFCLRSGWNYFGDSSVRFVDPSVCSAIGLDGHRHDHDPIVGGAGPVPGEPRSRGEAEPRPSGHLRRGSDGRGHRAALHRRRLAGRRADGAPGRLRHPGLQPLDRLAERGGDPGGTQLHRGRGHLAIRRA